MMRAWWTIRAVLFSMLLSTKPPLLMVLLPYALMLRKPDYCLATSTWATLSCKILIHHSSLLATPANKWNNQQLHLHSQQHLEISELKIVFRAQKSENLLSQLCTVNTRNKNTMLLCIWNTELPQLKNTIVLSRNTQTVLDALSCCNSLCNIWISYISSSTCHRC